ncbi:metalloproteinase inhibitor 4 [Dendropsophus ebraccatus]|uniref:metalloproteinase inhibitor 4 n=1 Tax=Dendropsophus ebraccatus TaxID=150705 RepID=UPI003831A2ED
MNPFTHTLLCCALLFLTLQELTEACSCAISHPQQQFCNTDTVVRAKVIGEKLIPSTDSFDSTIQYEIKVIKIFKVFEKMTDIHYVYTSSESSVCGVRLEWANKTEYILGGSIYDGRVRINLCGLVSTWDSLSPFQVKSLTQPHLGYQQGCACKIKFCPMEGCDSNTQDLECTWTDWQITETLQKQHACIKRRGGTCNWYPTIADKSIHTSHP